MNRLLKMKWQQEEVDSVRTLKSDCDAVGVALPELIDRLQQITALARIKYGNLDPDVDQYLKETEALIARVTGD